MATEKQIEANRRNSTLSTGPCTEAGREVSAQNHLKLGLFTRRDYVKPDERDLYKEFCDGFYSSSAPRAISRLPSPPKSSPPPGASAAARKLREILLITLRRTRCSTKPPKKPAAPSNEPATPPTATSIDRSTSSAKSKRNEPSASPPKVKTSRASPNVIRSTPLERNISPHLRRKNPAFPNSSSMTSIA